jgi:hypothetical protein
VKRRQPFGSLNPDRRYLIGRVLGVAYVGRGSLILWPRARTGSIMGLSNLARPVTIGRLMSLRTPSPRHFSI